MVEKYKDKYGKKWELWTSAETYIKALKGAKRRNNYAGTKNCKFKIIKSKVPNIRKKWNVWIIPNY